MKYNLKLTFDNYVKFIKAASVKLTKFIKTYSAVGNMSYTLQSACYTFFVFCIGLVVVGLVLR